MFTKIRLKNFKSFDDITFDISTSKKPKPLVVLYGKNGSGKSNVMSAFVFLSELLTTMDVRDRYENFLAHENELAQINDEKFTTMIRQQFLDGLRNMKNIIKDYKMIDSKDNISVEYEFAIGEKTGKYIIELDDEEIISEQLEFVLNKRKGNYFTCSRDSIVINSAIIKDNILMNSIKESARKYWGKHSMLAILSHERDDKSKKFIQNSFSENLYKLIENFMMMSGALLVGKRRWHSLATKFPIASRPVKGILSLDKEEELDRFTSIFTKVFNYTNKRIAKVYYKKTYLKNKIKYELFEKKYIAGKYIDIPFERESTGNLKLLDFFCHFINTVFGGVVILDEADAGIHELQFYGLIEKIKPYIQGQLIMSAHNTMLMELDDARRFVYVIDDDGESVKIRSISDYEKRTFANNNIRMRYLNDKYGGVPEKNNSIDFGLIFKELE